MAAKLSGNSGGKFDLAHNADMNVTPFVDVMLVLLIIFMVVAPLATVSIKLDLPPATPGTMSHQKPPTYLSIRDNGQLFLSMGDAVQPTSVGSLATDIPRSMGVANPTHEEIFVRADRHVRYRQFMGVINQLRRDGYFKIGLIEEDLS